MTVKCSYEGCTREVKKRFAGRNTPGRLPIVSAALPYCKAHYEQMRRRKYLGPIRKRGSGKYKQGVEDAATIVEYHGHKELATLLRSLNK